MDGMRMYDRMYYDVVIAGGGPAGLAAGLFTARYGLRTLILDRGKSLLRQCAYLDNYLGFPGGVTVPAFLDLARAQVSDAGADIARDRVTALEFAGSGSARFCVHTKDGASFLADRFVAASPYDVRYLRGLRAPDLLSDDGEFRGERVDAYGRTAVPGLYVAGPLAGVESQALISAGHAAQVALGLIRDVRRSHGLWDAIARHVDWLAWHGVYESRRWTERVYRYFEGSVPAQAGLDSAYVKEAIGLWVRGKRAQQLSKADVGRRGERGRRMLVAHLERSPAGAVANAETSSRPRCGGGREPVRRTDVASAAGLPRAAGQSERIQLLPQDKNHDG